ncbi:hypothetical protein D3C85_1629580 [compost metagenome]
MGNEAVDSPSNAVLSLVPSDGDGTRFVIDGYTSVMSRYDISNGNMSIPITPYYGLENRAPLSGLEPGNTQYSTVFKINYL